VAARAGARLVAGIDSSTQATKVVVRDADTGTLVGEGRAPHPDGTEVDPGRWWQALESATEGGLLDGVAAVAVGAQQHGMVCVDAAGAVVRPALLWNDTRSAQAAADLIGELGGPQAWAEAVGLVPVASFTVTKLRWLATHEPDQAKRTAAVLLPHDWLTWRLAGGQAEPVTDRGDASGTGYWSPATGAYRPDLLELAFGHLPRLPRVLGPTEPAGHTQTGILLGPGTGDNMAAALGVGARPGDVIVSVGRRRPGSLLRGRAHPQRPHATAHLSGLRLATTTPANLARAAVEGMLCGLADGLDALRRQGVAVGQVLLIGGGARPSPRPCSTRRSWCRPGSTSPTVPPGRRPGCSAATPSPPSGGRPCPHEPSKHHQHPTSTRPAAARDFST
jgi:sugar (pentulose or hexulose) kinase